MQDNLKLFPLQSNIIKLSLIYTFNKLSQGHDIFAC